MEKQLIHNLLLISGTGRNSGKTTLACNIISKFSVNYPIIAVKVSSHLNHVEESGKMIYQRENIYIAEESDTSKSKDSSRMLAAGAKKSFFIVVKDEQLIDAFTKIKGSIDKNDLIVCESGGLRNVVIPGLFFIVHHSENPSPKSESEKLKRFCDRWITFNGNNFDFSLNSLEIQNNKWNLTGYENDIV